MLAPSYFEKVAAVSHGSVVDCTRLLGGNTSAEFERTEAQKAQGECKLGS